MAKYINIIYYFACRKNTGYSYHNYSLYKQSQ